MINSNLQLIVELALITEQNRGQEAMSLKQSIMGHDFGGRSDVPRKSWKLPHGGNTQRTARWEQTVWYCGRGGKRYSTVINAHPDNR